MLKSEMTCKWEPWEEILRVLEESGKRRLDPNPTELAQWMLVDDALRDRALNQMRKQLFQQVLLRFQVWLSACRPMRRLAIQS